MSIGKVIDYRKIWPDSFDRKGDIEYKSAYELIRKKKLVYLPVPFFLLRFVHSLHVIFYKIGLQKSSRWIQFCLHRIVPFRMACFPCAFGLFIQSFFVRNDRFRTLIFNTMYKFLDLYACEKRGSTAISVVFTDLHLLLNPIYLRNVMLLEKVHFIIHLHGGCLNKRVEEKLIEAAPWVASISNVSFSFFYVAGRHRNNNVIGVSKSTTRCLICLPSIGHVSYAFGGEIPSDSRLKFWLFHQGASLAHQIVSDSPSDIRFSVRAQNHAFLCFRSGFISERSGLHLERDENYSSNRFSLYDLVIVGGSTSILADVAASGVLFLCLKTELYSYKGLDVNFSEFFIDIISINEISNKIEYIDLVKFENFRRHILHCGRVL